ncbi:XdhC family protein [Breoghania sp.]|uniref:XdhC family protein n=1 Tax=Breoghania sp. TaxID=2065378 RepID=UPI0032046D16
MLANSVFSAIVDAVASLKPGVIPPLDAPATPEAILEAGARLVVHPSGGFSGTIGGGELEWQADCRGASDAGRE